MNDTSPVTREYPGANRQHHIDNLSHLHWALMQSGSQIFALQVLHDNVGTPTFNTEIQDRHDVVVRQLTDGLSFPSEPPQAVLRHAAQRFDYHRALQHRITRAIHLRLPSYSKQLAYLVAIYVRPAFENCFFPHFWDLATVDLAVVIGFAPQTVPP